MNSNVNMEHCRVCLEVSDSKSYPLKGPVVNCDVSIGEMITYCTSIEVDQYDGFPTSVCVTCFRTLRIAYNFIRLFKENHEGLLTGTKQVESPVRKYVINSDNELAMIKDHLDVDSLGSEEQILKETEKEVEYENETEKEVEYENEIEKEVEYENEPGSFDGNEPESGEHETDLHSNNLVHQIVEDDKDQNVIEYYQLVNENGDVEQSYFENCDTEEFVAQEQESEEYEVEYEVIETENANDGLDYTLDEDIIYETAVTGNPEQKIIKVINRQPNSDNKQPTKLRRKIRTRLACPLCPNFFSSYEKELVPHMTKHEEEQAFPCNVCNSDSLYFVDSFLTHFHKTHRYQCPFCGKSCTRRQNLNAHMKGHSGTHYKCTFEGCNKTFPAAWNLKKHLRVHSDKPEYICSECGMEFNTYDTYRYHQKKHLGRKFLCTHCGQAFMQSVHLKYHMWTHTGEKNFKCDLCVKSYTSVTQLKKHRRRHHPKAKEFHRYEEIVEGT